jgi:2',3'-cyclic-nucleotide 2'-phosphodiesterase (5'-nucleotidase family)
MGVDVLVKLIEKSNFPWLLSNVFDGDSKEMLPLAKAFLKTIIEINGLKVGSNK